jgi:hypothetical protein
MIKCSLKKGRSYCEDCYMAIKKACPYGLTKATQFIQSRLIATIKIEGGK